MAADSSIAKVDFITILGRLSRTIRGGSGAGCRKAGKPHQDLFQWPTVVFIAAKFFDSTTKQIEHLEISIWPFKLLNSGGRFKGQNNLPCQAFGDSKFKFQISRQYPIFHFSSIPKKVFHLSNGFMTFFKKKLYPLFGRFLPKDLDKFFSGARDQDFERPGYLNVLFFLSVSISKIQARVFVFVLKPGEKLHQHPLGCFLQFLVIDHVRIWS